MSTCQRNLFNLIQNGQECDLERTRLLSHFYAHYDTHALFPTADAAMIDFVKTITAVKTYPSLDTSPDVSTFRVESGNLSDHALLDDIITDPKVRELAIYEAIDSLLRIIEHRSFTPNFFRHSKLNILYNGRLIITIINGRYSNEPSSSDSGESYLEVDIAILKSYLIGRAYSKLHHDFITHSLPITTTNRVTLPEKIMMSIGVASVAFVTSYALSKIIWSK